MLRVDAQIGTSRALGEAAGGSGDAPEKPKLQAQEGVTISRKSVFCPNLCRIPGEPG
jgi:hypothetical protein